MKKIAFISGILVLHPIAVGSDLWFGEDKKLHLLGSAILAAGIKEVTTDNIAFTGALSIGLLKEYYDYTHPDKHTASYKDLLFDIGGAYLGAYAKNCTIEYNTGQIIVRYHWILK